MTEPSKEPAVAVLVQAPAFEEAYGNNWDDSLPIYDVVPALLPVGCNAYLSGVKGVEQYVWLVVDSTADGVETADDRWIGRRPHRFESAIYETGWESILGVAHYDDWRDFLLREGLAPGQSFLVRVCFSSHRDYWGEYDEDWDVEVVARERMLPDEHLLAWETELGAEAILCI